MKKFTCAYALAFMMFYSVDTICMELAQRDINPEGLKFLLTDGVRWLNHDMIVALADVSTQCKKVVCDTADHRKEHVARLISHAGMSRGTTWHEYGTMCGNHSVFHTPTSHTLEIRCYSLEEGSQIKSREGRWPNFSEYVSCLGGLRINHWGHLCMYGWSQHKGPLRGQEERLSQYFLSKNGIKREIICDLMVTGHHNVSLAYFKLLPKLLKAFLNSRRVSSSGVNVERLLCHLDGATIPESYTDSDESFDGMKSKAFYRLSPNLQDAINHRYDWQEKK